MVSISNFGMHRHSIMHDKSIEGRLAFNRMIEDNKVGKDDVSFVLVFKLLFKTEQFFGEVVSSGEGQMEWIDYNSLSEIDAVDDLEELL